MSRYSIVLVDSDYTGDLKYHLADYHPEFDCDNHKFTVDFFFGPDGFAVKNTSLTHYKNEVPCCETKQRTHKAKKPKKPSRKG